MRKTLYFLLLVGFFTCRAQAAPGTCPTTANYVNPASPTTTTTLTVLGITNGCYYVSSGGSDANTGICKIVTGTAPCTSGNGPWLHAPGMPNCTSACATAAASSMAGVGIIFRGGDTWHYGNGSASPYTGGAWTLSSSATLRGTATAPFYLGVDSTWYSGTAWVRPIMSADNAVNASTTLTSCAYQIGGNIANNNFMYPGQYTIVDNFEWVGLCQAELAILNGTTCESPYAGTNNIVFSYNELGKPVHFLNNYIHGFSHIEFGTPTDSEVCVVGHPVFNAYAWRGCVGTGNCAGPVGEDVFWNVVDFTDSDPQMMGLGYWGGYNVAYNYFGNTCDNIVRTLHSWHDNLYEYYNDQGHSNVLENLSSGPSPGVVYNNVFRHFGPNKSQGGLWLFGSITNYVFNNVYYDIYPNQFQYLAMGGTPTFPGNAPYIFFNNTWQADDINPSGISTAIPEILACSAQLTVTGSVAANNHYIYSSPYSAECSTLVTDGLLTLTTELTMSNVTAGTIYSYSNTATQRYPTGQVYPYAPNTASYPTVGTGTNKYAYCTTLAGNSDAAIAAAGAACKKDTTFGISYNTSNHTVSSPARTPVLRPVSTSWDIGAYQFSAGSQVPAVTFNPTSVSFGSIAVGSSSSAQNVILTNSGTGGLTISSMAISGTNGGDFGFGTTPSSNCGGALTASGTCTLAFVFTPSVGGSESATFSMVDNASGSPHTIALSGTGIATNAPNPSCIPGTSTYNQPPYPTVTCSYSTPVMCLTVNGTTPATNGVTGCTNGAIYNAPLSISGTTTLKVIAGGTGYSDSSVITYVYTIQPAAVAPAAKIFAKVLVN